MHIAGTGIPVELKDDVIDKGAIFDGPSECYRYKLFRTWDRDKPSVLFIMMNPSIATAEYDDPTVAKCGMFARRWGFGTLFIGNSFAYRCTEPKRLLAVEDPNGPENDKFLIEMANESEKVILAYGLLPTKLRYRGAELVVMLKDNGINPLFALKLLKDGKTPGHPLYLPHDTKPIVYCPMLPA